MSKTEQAELIKSSGADKVFDFTKEDFIRSGEKYNSVFDTIGMSTLGKYTLLIK